MPGYQLPAGILTKAPAPALESLSAEPLQRLIIVKKQINRFRNRTAKFTSFIGMLTAGDGTVFIDGTFAVTCKMNAGIVNEQVPPCGILEHFHVVVIELP